MTNALTLYRPRIQMSAATLRALHEVARRSAPRPEPEREPGALVEQPVHATPDEPLLETFKPIVGFEDSYIISSFGRVIRTKRAQGTRPGKILTPGINSVTGYLTVALSRHGVVETHYVHRLVAEAWLGRKLKPGEEVHHRDDDKSNNSAANLLVVTRSENMRQVAGRGR